MNGAAPPAPPPPAFNQQQQQQQQSSNFVETTGDSGRDALLASIRGAGGVHALRKVDKSQLEKPSPLLQKNGGDIGGSSAPAQYPAGAAPQPGAQAGAPASLADALAAALNQRKNKVGRGEDDSDKDDW
ncbi:hypothetical protein C6P41_001975 [Kluyveromyces marxianus]|nr:hypothetical protein C6P41_001975 [Kluyveromyces marxianus]